MEVATARLVQATEVWVPDAEGNRLEWSSGDYGPHDRFAQVSRETSFGQGEGMPGRVWASGCPEVMHDLFSGGFQREGIAAEIGLTSGVAIPVMREGKCLAVVTMLCNSGDFAEGAFEVWKQNDRNELAISSSYYANLDRFGRVSQYVKFPRRSGLPGITWDRRHPILLEGIGTSKSFMRAAGAKAGGLNIGIGLPIMSDLNDLEAVLVVLSSLKTPIAQVFEFWIPEVEQVTDDSQFPETTTEVYRNAVIEAASYGPLESLAEASRDLSYSPGEGIVGQVMESELPVATSDCSTLEPARADVLRESQCGGALGMPIFVGRTMVAVLVMIS